MPKTTPEAWLRGPVPDVPQLLQPVAHALVGAREDIEATVEPLSAEQWWRRVGDSASIGFHVMHLAGSTDRLLTYARGEALTDRQKDALARERKADEQRPTVIGLG